MVRKDETVAVRVTEERKENWEQAAEERGMTTGDFVRFAVMNEIDGRGTDEANVSVDLDPIENELDSLQTDVTAIVDQLATVTEELESDDTLPEGAELNIEAVDIIATLPEREELPKSEAYKTGLSPEDVSEKLGVPVEPVKKALRNLASKSGRVVRVGHEIRDGEVVDEGVYLANV